MLGLALFLILAAAGAILRPYLTSPIDSYAACIEAGYPVLQTDPPICRENSRSFRGTSAPAAPIAAPLENVGFDLLVDGDTHNPQPGHEQVYVTAPEQWSAYWGKVHAGLATQPPLLPVDFAKNDVLGVSLGQQNTSGYDLKITGISSGPNGTAVSLTESTPTITCPVAKLISNPYVIVRTAKLKQPVYFRITPEKRHC